MAAQTNQIYEFGPFRIDGAERRLLRNGRPVSLTPKAFDVLLLLVESSEHVVGKNELMDRVWGDSFVEESNLKVTISMLRKALAEDGGERGYIETVSKHGYRFAANVKQRFDESGDLVVHEMTRSSVTIEQEEEGPLASVRSVSNAQYLIGKIKLHKRGAAIGLVGAALVIAAAVFGIYRLQEQRNRPFLFQIGKVTRLTTNGKIGNVAALSPDGKLFAYSLREGEKESLWLGHVDGGEAVQIHAPADVGYTNLTFAPDGSRLYYSTTRGQTNAALYRLPVFGGAPERIRDNVRNHITFAPDGKRFAFVRPERGSGKTALIVADIEGGGERVIAWSPDKRTFAWHSAAWSPDGATIALGGSVNDSDTSYDVFTVNAAEPTLRPLTSYGWHRVESVTWRPDGSGLIVVARDRNSILRQLWSVSYPGGEAKRVLTDLTIYDYSSLSADNHSLLTIQTQEQSNVWVAPSGDLSQAKQVTFGSFGRQNGYVGLDWTADERIIYTARSDDGWAIWVVNADGSEQKQLIPAGGANVHPSVTDDNRYLVFQSNRSGKYEVWRANLDGSDMQQLTDADIAAQPDVSPDGKWIVYVSNREDLGTLYRISIDAGEPVQLSDKRTSWVRISPDSRYVACGYEDEGKTRLAILPIEGGAPLKRFDIPRLANLRLGIRWTPDGKSVTYRDWTNGIWKQNLEGGEPERLSGLPEEKLYGYGWSHDAKLFAFSRGVEARDVILLSNSR
ncbi:MAG TPA: winged helix-turn-helix domain-containing protein [Candidatus Binatia bacterium]|jgi:Tol biopolymer transport system component/DNA-binding winged helix-turn-helix (wHTH) protein